MSWQTVPLCEGCWKAMHPVRQPVRLAHPDQEVCADCGQSTESGIYVRRQLS